MASRFHIATEEAFIAAQTKDRAGHDYDREVITFRLADERYGLDISAMREILKMREVTELPRVPKFLTGIVTVRGEVIPIIDLRRRLGLTPSLPTRASRILVTSHDEQLFGLIVDEVHKVVRMLSTDIQPTPLPGGIESDFLAGVSRSDGDLIVLLNLPSVVTFRIEGS
jgi:purine-binding chemotaxis protein CheW